MLEEINYKIVNKHKEKGHLRLTLEDNNGYRYYILKDNFLKRSPRITDKNNIYSIYNINRWLIDNNKTVKLLSTEYISNDSKMLWLCECGEQFESSWSKIRYRNRNYCNKCSKYLNAVKRNKFDILKKDIESKGYKILSKGYYTQDDHIDVMDRDGYKYNLVARSILKYKPSAIINSNPFVIENIKLFLKKNQVPVKLLSNKYERSNEELLFLCHCGRKFNTTWMNLLYENKIVCDECSKKMSNLERLVMNYLDSNNVKYDYQKSYDDCFFNIKGKLRFDFFVNNKLIEVQGIQHYKPIDFFGGIEGYKYQKKRDETKRVFCKKNNIPLLEISYLEFKNENYKKVLETFINT